MVDELKLALSLPFLYTVSCNNRIILHSQIGTDHCKNGGGLAACSAVFVRKVQEIA